MISRFFIERPIFAWVVAIVIMLAGLLALRTLPISQYPQIAPTTVQISANYPGADAATVENSVTKVIEQGMTGLDNLQYMTATSTSTGNASITLTFTSAADPDVAQMQVQNKLQLVTRQLPSVGPDHGISVAKASTGFLMVVAFVSKDGRMTTTDLADYVDSTLNDTLKRVEGVGTTQLFGAGYAMRIWLNPDALRIYADAQRRRPPRSRRRTRRSPPASSRAAADQGQQLNATVTAASRLQTVSQFENIILKSGSSGSIVRLNDVARVELGAKSYDTASATTASRRPASPSAGDRRQRDRHRQGGPVHHRADEADPAEGVDVTYRTTTPFVQLSIEKVVTHAVRGDHPRLHRHVRLPAEPAGDIHPDAGGARGAARHLRCPGGGGYSINTLTMFAMVLAIGLLVDDAIVVVENVERVMQEEKLGPKEATIKSMNEITARCRHRDRALGGVRADGLLRRIGRHHLPPVLDHHRHGHDPVRRRRAGSDAGAVRDDPEAGEGPRRPKGFFGWFNRNFERTTNGYRSGSPA